MPLDTRIPLGIQPVEQRDPMEMYGRMLGIQELLRRRRQAEQLFPLQLQREQEQLKGSQLETQERTVSLADKQRLSQSAQAVSDAYANFYDQDKGTFDWAGADKYLVSQKQPEAAAKLRAAKVQLDRDAIALTAEQRKAKREQLQEIGDAAFAFENAPPESKEALWYVAHKKLRESGDPINLPEKYDPNDVESHRALIDYGRTTLPVQAQLGIAGAKATEEYRKGGGETGQLYFIAKRERAQKALEDFREKYNREPIDKQELERFRPMLTMEEFRREPRPPATTPFAKWLEDNPGGTVEQWDALQVKQAGARSAAEKAAPGPPEKPMTRAEARALYGQFQSAAEALFKAPENQFPEPGTQPVSLDDFIKQVARSRGYDIDEINRLAGPERGAPAKGEPWVQQNPTTKEFRHSYDGGKTWRPGKP